MKGKILIIGLLLLILLPSYSYASGLGEMRISLLEGDVQVRPADASEWVPASINMPLTEGDGLWVPQGGRTEVQLRNGTSVRLDSETSIEILRIEKDASQFYLAGGSVYVYMQGTGNTLLQMDTPVSSIRAYGSIIFMADARGDGSTEVSVLRGAVDVEGRSGSTRVAANKTLSLWGDGYSELTSLAPSDGWVRWNRDRDGREYGKMYNSTYLPAELAGYSSDFDENGRWVYNGSYGYVWTPTVMVSAGWAPYRNGRWTWVAGDYVWVSYEPWGWAPYHYGRWTFVTSVGWCWVPPARDAVYWAPGYVGWVETPTHVAWVPLGPGDIYYGRGYYGPQSVNITNINIEKTVMQNNYRNVHIGNAVTVVNRDTFARGRQVALKVAENPFLRGKILAGRPEIKPERTAFMPVIKNIPVTKQPPRQFRDLQAKQLLKERPLTKGSRVSVFSPASTGKNVVEKSTRSRSFGVVKTPEARVLPQTRRIQPFKPGQAANEKKVKGLRENGAKTTAVQQPAFQRPAVKDSPLRQVPAVGSVGRNKPLRAPSVSEVRIPSGQLKAGDGRTTPPAGSTGPRLFVKQQGAPAQAGPAAGASLKNAFSGRPVVERQKENVMKETGRSVQAEIKKPVNEVQAQRPANLFR